MLGLGVNTFYRRVKLWGWRRRRLRVAEVDAMAREIAASEAALADAELADFAARVADDRRSSATRARDAVMAQFAAIEASRARIAKASASAIEGERSARTLLALAQALRHVGALEREEAEARVAAARQAEASESAYEPEDVDAMRRRLADRLRSLMLDHEAKGPEAPPPSPQRGAS